MILKPWVAVVLALCAGLVFGYLAGEARVYSFVASELRGAP